MDISFFAKNLWKWKCGFKEDEPYELANMPELSVLVNTEWSLKFEQLMKNRMLLGAFRYGRLGAKGKPQYDRIDSIKKRLNKYIETGNTEHLVDCANLLMLEFVEGKHPNKHFAATDDEEHTNVRW